MVEAAALGEAGGFYLCPPHGRWCPGDGRRFYRIRNALLEDIGIPTNFEGVAFFGGNEPDRLSAAIFARCFMVDDCVGDASDDVFVYPSHGRLYLHVDDEEITWAMAARGDPLSEFDEDLSRRGWGWLRNK
jgi:hypothetical protein